MELITSTLKPMRTNVRIVDAGDYLYQSDSPLHKTREELRCELETHVQQAYSNNRQPDGVILLSYKHGFEPFEKPYDFELQSVQEENGRRVVVYENRVI